MKKGFIAAILVTLVIVFVFLIGRLRKVDDQTVILSDGSAVRMLDVTVGTQHQIGLQIGNLFKLLPEPVTETLEGWLGTRSRIRTFQTSKTNLVVWLEHSGMTLGKRVSRSVMLKVPGGRLSGEKQYASLQLGNGTTNRVHSMSFGNWPRREKWIECAILEQNDDYEEIEIGSFRLLNPLLIDQPGWTPEQGPVVKLAGDVKVTLEDFATGIGNQRSNRKTPNGFNETVYQAAAPGKEPHSIVNVDFQSPKGTNETWVLFDSDLSDALGNQVRAKSRSGMSDMLRFSPVLWPDESAWKLRLHLKRKAGFLPGELITFSNVPLPILSSTNFPQMTNIVMGIESRLTEIRRLPPLDKSRRSWSGRDFSGFRLDHDALGDTNQIDLVSMTIQPMRKMLQTRGSSWSDTYHQYQLESIPSEGTHIDLVFSVQKARFVEFLVAPNWVTNEYVMRERD